MFFNLFFSNSFNYISSISFPGVTPMENLIQGRGPELTIIGMSVVFSGLIILTISLFIMERIIRWHEQKSRKKSQATETEGSKKEKVMTGEEAAAICTAIILYHRLHMGEYRQKITFQPSAKPLSPWSLSSKPNLPFSR